MNLIMRQKEQEKKLKFIVIFFDLNEKCERGLRKKNDSFPVDPVFRFQIKLFVLL
jgi:hypothetical protein